jgi:hypothetical protein
MQGARIFRIEAYIEVRRMTKDEAQHSPSTLLRAMSLSNGRWSFCEADNLIFSIQQDTLLLWPPVHFGVLWRPL